MPARLWCAEIVPEVGCTPAAVRHSCPHPPLVPAQDAFFPLELIAPLGGDTRFPALDSYLRNSWFGETGEGTGLYKCCLNAMSVLLPLSTKNASKWSRKGKTLQLRSSGVHGRRLGFRANVWRSIESAVRLQGRSFKESPASDRPFGPKTSALRPLFGP